MNRFAAVTLALSFLIPVGSVAFGSGGNEAPETGGSTGGSVMSDPIECSWELYGSPWTERDVDEVKEKRGYGRYKKCRHCLYRVYRTCTRHCRWCNLVRNPHAGWCTAYATRCGSWARNASTPTCTSWSRNNCTIW